MESKRVLMIAQSTYNYDPRIMRYCKALRELDYEIDVICLKYSDQNKYDVVDGVRVFRIMNRFSLDSIFSYFFFSLTFLFKSFLKTILLVRKNKYSVVHVHNMPDFLVFAALYPKIIGLPVILDIHDLTVELFREKWGAIKFKLFKPILAAVEKICIKFSDKVITVSDQCAEKLIQRGTTKDKITIVMNVPDLRYFAYNEKRNFNRNGKGFHLIYHGTIAGRYGLHNVIKILPTVLEKESDIIFHIIGRMDNEYSDYLKDLTKDLNLDNHVIFEEIVPYYEVSNRLKSADLGIALSENNEYANLGIPTKIFEYAAVGLPVIVTDLVSVRSTFRDSSMIFVNPEDTNQIANEIIKIVNNPEGRRSLAKNANVDLKQVSYEVMCERYLDLLNSIENIVN